MTAFHTTISLSDPPAYPASFLSAIPENNDDLQREITTLAGHINAANYRFLKLLAVLVERGAWNGGGIKSPAHWLNYYCGISLGPAREKVRVAMALNELPLIDAAFATGALSFSKVRAMTRVATKANEDYLLMIARHGTACHIEKLVRKFQRVTRQSREDQDKVQHEARGFSCHYDDDGMLVFHGRLAPEDGALLLKAMETIMQQTSSKDVSAETSSPEADEEPDTFPQKRADALVRMAEHTLATAADGPVPLAGGDKVQVVVHINTDAAAHPHEPSGYIEDGPALSPQTVRRLADAASLVTILEDGKGNVLNVGRKTRTIPPAIRRALATRDGGCRFPGCCESRFVDAHHIHHWCDGGETRLDNLVLLCRHHHRLVHEEGYGIAMGSAGKPVFTTPGGKTMRSSHFPQFPQFSDMAGIHVSAETFFGLELEHEKSGVAIDSATAITAWRGERMDYGMGVEALLRRES